MRQIKEQLNKKYFERVEEIEGILTCILAQEHCLFLGLPGTAKSDLARDICNCIDGANFFSWLLTKFSTPEELFGPISLSSLEKDEYKRIVKGKFPEAHIAFPDEIFKANSSILNSLLTALNEKIFFNGNDIIQIPLITCIGASNELPEDSSLNALFDRFLARYWITYIQDNSKFKELISRHTEISIPKITLETLKLFQNEVSGVSIPDEIYEIIIQLKNILEQEGIIVSDRRWRKIIKFLQANAVLNDEDTIMEKRIKILKNCLWSEPNQRVKINDIINGLLSPESIQIFKILDAAKEEYKNIPATKMDKSQAISLLAKVIQSFDEQIKELAGIKLEAKDSEDVDNALLEIGKMRNELSGRASKLMGL